MSTPLLLFLGDLGGGEILLIMVVILIFFGANKIPELARGLGKGIREFKDASREIRSEIENAGSPNHYQPQNNNNYQQPPYPQQAPPAYPAAPLDQPTAGTVAPPQTGPVAAPDEPTVTPAGLPHDPAADNSTAPRA